MLVTINIPLFVYKPFFSLRVRTVNKTGLYCAVNLLARILLLFGDIPSVEKLFSRKYKKTYVKQVNCFDYQDISQAKRQFLTRARFL